MGPGNSPGTLTVSDAFSLAGTSILSFELNAGDTTPGGVNNDLITGVTNLTLVGFLDITGSGDWTNVVVVPEPGRSRWPASASAWQPGSPRGSGAHRRWLDA